MARETHRTKFKNSSLGPRRQTMSNQELSVFEDMFNIVFSTAQERRLQEDGPAAEIDVDAHSPLSGFLKNLSKHPRAHQKGEDPELDKLKEQLDLCPSDFAMLEWAEREVFGPSRRAEEASRAAASEGKPPPGHLQPPLYPHLLAALMSTARARYDDPNLALALFEHARNLSPLSYIFGCTTPAYNELLETRWGSFRDLRGVHAGLEEMRANGISTDSRTRALVDDVRREVGARTIWLEESETGSGEVWAILKEIERLVARRAPRQAWVGDHPPHQGQQQQPHDAWKNPELTSDESSGYRFGEWPEPGRRQQPRRPTSQS
jgi:Mtf2 family